MMVWYRMVNGTEITIIMVANLELNMMPVHSEYRTLFQMWESYYSVVQGDHITIVEATLWIKLQQEPNGVSFCYL